MKQVLSQQEIDALLNALSTGEIDPETIEEETNKVRSYDFRRPIKLSKEYINTIQMIFENFSKIADNLLSTQLRTNVDINLGSLEQISYDEFIRSIPRFTLAALFTSDNLGGTQIMEINPQFCLQVIELVCGGSPSDYTEKLSKKDSFTDIELGILEELVRNLLTAFESAWSEILDIKTNIDSIETNPQLTQTMSPNEPVVLASFTVEIFETRSFINICIPYISFEQILDKLSFKSWFDFEKEVDEDNREVLEKRVKSVAVDLEVLIGKAYLTVSDFLQLEKGDVFQLDLKTTDPLKLYIEGKPYYLVRPGKVNDKYGVEILQYIEEGVD